MSDHQTNKPIGRRGLLAGAAAAATVSIIKPSLVRGTQANSTVEVGLIGCGGRGNWITKLFSNSKNGNYKWVACCDYHDFEVERTGTALGIPVDRRYSTLSGYKKLLDSKLDAVVIESPPYFHPQQAADAVDAGKHAYVAKPVAVDVPGCQLIGTSGQKAAEKKLVFLVDFQTRANKFYQQAAAAVHSGEIGRLVCCEARYPWGVGNFDPPPSPAERLGRGHWYCVRALSGDFIIEQNIHAIDVACWFLNADPIKAVGVGGSKKLRRFGDIWDNFAVNYTFPDSRKPENGNIVMSFTGNQCTPGAPDEIPCRIYGSRGTVDTDYFSHVSMNGDPKFVKAFEGKIENLYGEGAATNVRTFYESIVGSKYENSTVPQAVRSNLTAVMGRDSAYRGEPILWEQFIKSTDRMEPDLSGLKS